LAISFLQKLTPETLPRLGAGGWWLVVGGWWLAGLGWLVAGGWYKSVSIITTTATSATTPFYSRWDLA